MVCIVVFRSLRWTVGILFFFFQAEDGIRDLVRSRGLGDVYKRQVRGHAGGARDGAPEAGRDTVAPPARVEIAVAGRKLSLIHI